MPVKHEYPRWKVTKIDWQAVQAMDDTSATASLYTLTRRQTAILLAFMEQLKWKTRWDNFDATQDELDSLQAELSDALMAEYTIDCEQVENCIETSDTILAIQAQVASNTAGVASNDDDINDINDTLQNEPPDGYVYSDVPASGTDARCGASHYIVSELRSFIVTIEDTPTTYSNPLEAIIAIVSLVVPIVFETLRTIILSWFSASPPSSVLSTYDTYSDDMTEYLFCESMDKDDFSGYVRSSISAGIADYIDCIASSAWQRWINVGSVDNTQDCDGYCDADYYLIPATANPFTGAGVVSIPMLAGQTIHVEYIEYLWDWQPVTPRWTGAGGGGNAPSGSVIVGQPLASLIYSPRNDSLNWFVGGNDFYYTYTGSGNFLLACLDGDVSSYANNVGSIKVRVTIT